MSGLAEYVRILGRGPGRARALTEAEAQHALRLILAGEAAPEATGALLMLMRYRGETAEEVAGFTRAARDTFAPWPGPAPDVDWPSYAAGRSRGLPLFLLAARLVAHSGRRVLLHGWNSHQSASADVRSALRDAGIAYAASPGAAARQITRAGIAYLPLEALSPPILDLLRLRETLGLRSCLNTVARMLNPAAAALTVQGVFHPSYRALQRDAAALLGQPASLTIKGGGGEFERHPAKPIEIVGLRHGVAVTETAPPLIPAARRLADGPDLPPDPASLAALWAGHVRDDFAEACIVGTAALVLQGLRPGLSEARAREDAQRLWARRTAEPERISA
ncbi:MAG: glycosyl transferase family protein [Pseudomonadota bacterium]